ncbi:MAG: hypothetical protein MPK62_01500 [Alphaproteobacteria bacterium]|nr:hypothetical protein [Alphaproteobacteria bacterium]MDA8029809.1 hypothetical protein [Alphaproteobacteria bacterium]
MTYHDYRKGCHSEIGLCHSSGRFVCGTGLYEYHSHTHPADDHKVVYVLPRILRKGQIAPRPMCGHDVIWRRIA